MKSFSAILALAICAYVASAQATDIDPANYSIRLTDLGPGVIPTAINNVGQVAGQANGQAFRWESGILTPLGTLGGAESYASDLNDAGVVVGWSHDALGKQKSFRWGQVAGVMEDLDATVTLEGAAEGINNHGAIVGWRTNGPQMRSVYWDEFTPNGRALFNSFNHKALGINDLGDVVGIALFDNLQPSEGYYWDSSTPGSSITEEIGSSYFP